MTAMLEALPVWLAGVIVIGGFVGATMLIGAAIHRLAGREVRRRHNDLAGFILAVVGVIYAVLLAFVAVGVWERFDQAEVRVSAEASSLSLVYRDAGDFPQSKALRAALRGYIHLVIDREWPAMQEGRESLRAERATFRIDALLRTIPVRTLAQANVQARMLQAFDRSLMERSARLSIGLSGINQLLWMVIVVGGFITVGFTYLFGFEEFRLEIMMNGTLALLIGLVLFLMISLDFPFRGGITVEPTSFEKALAVFRAIGH